MYSLPFVRDIEPAAAVSSTILAASLQLEAEGRAREAELRRRNRQRELDDLVQRRLQRVQASKSKVIKPADVSPRSAPAVVPLDPRSRCGVNYAMGVMTTHLGRKIDRERAMRFSLETRIREEVNLRNESHSLVLSASDPNANTPRSNRKV